MRVFFFFFYAHGVDITTTTFSDCKNPTENIVLRRPLEMRIFRLVILNIDLFLFFFFRIQFY